MKRMLAIAAIVLCPVPAATAADDKAPRKETFVRDSVYEGLKEDGVAPKFAATLAENPDFVKKCQLCDQTLRALRDYATLDKTPTAKKDHGIPAEVAQRLASKDGVVRRTAFRDLIEQYVERGFARQKLTAEEKAEVEKFVKAMSYQPKDGVLPGGLKFCPSCDGACRIKPKAIIK